MKSVRLSDCCDFFSGGTPNKSQPQYWNGNIPWFSPKDLKSFDLTQSQDGVTETALSESAARIVEAGGILAVGRSGILAHTFPIGIVRQPSAFNQDIKAIMPHNGWDSEYIALYLKFRQQDILSNGVKRGPTVHSLRANFIEDIHIPVLRLDDQREIATRIKGRLEEVETVRRTIRMQWLEAITLKSKALESILNNVLIRKPIGSTAKLQSGYAFKSVTFKKKGVRLLRNTNILPGRVYWDDSVFLDAEESKSFSNYILSAGDVLVSLDRPIISSGIKVARVNDCDLPALLVQRVGRFLIDPEHLDADYLCAYLQTNLFASQISGHDQSLGVPHISPSQVEDVEMPMPGLSVQKELAKQLNEIVKEWEKLLSAIREQLDDLSKLPQAILAQAFGS